MFVAYKFPLGAFCPRYIEILKYIVVLTDRVSKKKGAIKWDKNCYIKTAAFWKTFTLMSLLDSFYS